jgi:Protein of unknown function (DUF2911)
VVPFFRFGVVAVSLMGAALFTAVPLLAQQSPPAETSVSISGKTIRINYSAPSMRGRKIFGGLEPYGRVWRAGANDATALHTDANLDIGGLAVPKGDYTLFVYLDPNQWQLIVSKQTGEWGLDYNQSHDLGRVKMDMSKAPKPIETYKMTLSGAGANKAKLRLEWENTVADIGITVK